MTGITEPRRRADYAPVGTNGKTGLFATRQAHVTEFSEDNMTDWAAALTYYGLLSLFPALIALVSIVGLVGDPATTTRTSPTSSRASARLGGRHLRRPDRVDHVEAEAPPASCSSSASALALWSASGYIGAFMRAANVVYETPEGRPIWKLRPLQILVTLVMVILLAVVALAIVMTGPIVTAVAEPARDRVDGA